MEDYVSSECNNKPGTLTLEKPKSAMSGKPSSSIMIFDYETTLAEIRRYSVERSTNSVDNALRDRRVLAVQNAKPFCNSANLSDLKSEMTGKY